MFNIYDGGVRSFSGTLERLYDVRPVREVSPTRREAREDRREPDDAAPRKDDEASAPTPAAIAAYREATRLSSREPVVHAHQVMQSPVVTVRPDADVRDAWLQMRDRRIRQMPVQTPALQLVGLLSERELLEQLIVDRDEIRYGRARDVASVMQHEVITADPVTDVRRIARVMADRDMTAMPIVSANDELLGIVSRGDLLRAMTRTPPLRLWT